MSNILNDGCEDSAEVDELASENSCDANSDLSDTLRKISISNLACNTMCPSSQGNYLFNAIKKTDVAMKAGSRHRKLIRLTNVMIDDIRKFLSECYELNNFYPFS